jgi:hypothetical protein
MKNEALYNKTVDILVQAYFEDSLSHMLCQACAVGNIIAYHTNQRDKSGKLFCKDYSWSGLVRGHWIMDTPNEEKIADIQVKSTGYTAQQLLQIETAFEKCNGVGDRMFNGLMAVIEVLDQIHENTDTQITTSAKERFKKTVA